MCEVLVEQQEAVASRQTMLLLSLARVTSMILCNQSSKKLSKGVAHRFVVLVIGQFPITGFGQ